MLFVEDFFTSDEKLAECQCASDVEKPDNPVRP